MNEQKNFGTVVQVIGPVLDVKFADGQLPNLLNALEVDNNGTTVVAEVAQHIGGDTVRRSEGLPGGLQPAVNRILPYAAPEFTGMDQKTAWELSLCCLENARDILLALETEFRALYARNLTLNRLGEAVILPLCPDKGGCTYDISRAASACLEGDIEILKRMRPAD